ncbi:hypothetical protein GLOIN_2v1726076 [Rhizophagus clarus]|uniref:Uncharacterized protein n=1 Tax=Rhizophagus clarus TaxID=94130 RepID=A0A8H3QUS0_9GLOM|nr:hypothetical protein GLOIN_2v1726076 [Rhizophagus clarus]
MYSSTEWLNVLKYSAFWENTDEPSLIGHHWKKALKWRRFMAHKKSNVIHNFWDLQAKRQTILMEIEVLEKKNKLLEKEQNELENRIDLEQSPLLQEDITKKFEARANGHTRVHFHEEEPFESRKSGKRGNILPDANDHNDEDEEALPSEDSFASAQNLDFTFGQNVGTSNQKQEEAKKTHLFESREYDTFNSHMQYIQKQGSSRYLGFYYGNTHTEVDVIRAYIIEGLSKNLKEYPIWSTDHINGRKCDVRFLTVSGIDVGEWEFSAKATKAIGDRCRSARINQSILNNLMECNLDDEQDIEKLKTPINVIKSVMGFNFWDDTDTVKPITFIFANRGGLQKNRKFCAGSLELGLRLANIWCYINFNI